MRKITGYRIRLRDKKIEKVEIEITEHGTPYFYLSEFFRQEEYEEKAVEPRLDVNNILFIRSGTIDSTYQEYLKWQHEQDEVAHLTTEDLEKQKEENEKKTFFFGNTEYTKRGICWRGDEPVDMFFSDALVLARNFADQYVNTNLDKEDMKDLVDFKEFTASEICYKIDKGFNLIAW